MSRGRKLKGPDSLSKQLDLSQGKSRAGPLPTYHSKSLPSSRYSAAACGENDALVLGAITAAYLASEEHMPSVP